ncbi:MAG TPA: hypothetical protein VMS93_05995 [Candidatus Saccharimonadales bacterium]|nr:hypothetical protein [Candidatus Saccharimonadales bacterium]
MNAPKLRMTRGSYLLLAVLAGVLLWTHAMDSRVKQMRAQAAAQAAAAAMPGAAGAAAGPPGEAGGGPAATQLAAMRVAPWGEDPFWKEEAAPRPQAVRGHGPWKPTGRGLKLKGILWAGTEAASSAQICDEVVRVGETAYRWTVLRITPNSVTLADRGAVITLHLHEDEP